MEELKLVKRLRLDAEIALLMPASHGPEVRPWLWPFCLNFLDIWSSSTARPNGAWASEEPSPALAFLTECIRELDETVNEAAILFAKKSYGFDTEDERSQAYEDWSQSELAQKMRERDL